MAKNLVIVESPAKAKTIEKFLGQDYVVSSSYGHVRDLSKEDLSVDIENNFEPHYEISADKKKVIAELKKLIKDVETVWLATDEDREGEAISWHLLEALKLDESQVKRIVFHEITKPAITRAIENPRTIDKNLVDAQQARRVLDRLVGYELSPVLWKKVKPSLSAGRVQSVAVRLIVERERDIIAFKPEISFKPKAIFQLNDAAQTELGAELSGKIDSYQEALEFVNHCNGAQFLIDSIEVKPTKKSPAPPFTTSTLQQEASRKLGFSVSKTMTLAQRLYESGLITYMRTDSVNLSQLAIDAAKQTISSQFGENYSKPRQYTTKSKSAQEAHEAIRPTYLNNQEVDAGYDESRLYDLIWKRTVASQMTDAQLERTTIKISISQNKYHFQATGNVVKFDGFLKVYNESSDDEEENKREDVLLPPVTKGQDLALIKVISRERFSRPPARYTEAALVRKLEELGIGRPSTYAPTISTVQKRNYVVKESRDGQERTYKVIRLQKGSVTETSEKETFGTEKNKLFPNDIGMLVTDFLTEHFDEVMDYNFTASVEREFDEIASGGKQWQEMLHGFYHHFHERIEETSKADRARQLRELGNHPETGEPIYAKLGRYGPFVQLGEGSEDEKPKFAKMRSGQLIETISIEEALELFKLPRELGEFEEKPVTADIGRFGPYVKHANKFVSIPKGEDPYEIEIDRAIELIKAKREADANKFINEFEHGGNTIQILNGRWGPYIKQGRTNYKIPKGVEAKDLTLDETLKIMEENPPKKKGRRKK